MLKFVTISIDLDGAVDGGAFGVTMGCIEVEFDLANDEFSEVERCIWLGLGDVVLGGSGTASLWLGSMKSGGNSGGDRRPLGVGSGTVGLEIVHRYDVESAVVDAMFDFDRRWTLSVFWSACTGILRSREFCGKIK